MSVPAHLARWVLAVFLGFAGAAHLSFARVTFQAQVPTWFPVPADLVVVASGVIELALAVALIVPTRQRPMIGWIVAAYLLAIFPGNIAQWAERRSAFGLDTDTARATRLVFQPFLIAWALWCTGAWQAFHQRHRH